MGASSTQKKSRCGMLGTMFRTCKFWPAKRSLSTGSLPRFENNKNNNVKASPSNTWLRRSDVDQGFKGGSCVSPPSKLIVVHQQNHVPKPPVEAAIIPKVTQRKVPKETISISGELESMIVEYQQVKGDRNLVRASSGNFMLYGHLGNLGQPVGGNKNECNKIDVKPDQGSPCKDVPKKMVPDKLKKLGDLDYKKGNFAEALSLYEAAIAIDPLNASYRSDKSAALEASGRILEAVFECNAALRIKPRNLQAHRRLANLYLRLGEVENTKYHCKRAGPEANQDDIARAKTLEEHLNKCNDAKRFRRWNVVLKETDSAIKAGADSSPHIWALKVEALLKLHRHQEANEAFLKGPKFNDDDTIKHFGPIGVANLLVVQAQVDMAAGRFDEALVTAERAARLDSKSKEVNNAINKARAVATRQSIGNEHFRSSNFYDACITYGEALEHDPHNSVLLHNRATCYSKLGQHELAVEDCTHALSVCPGYTKARLLRANCNYKLGRSEAAIEDYKILTREMPDNKEVKLGLTEAQGRLKDKKKRVRWKHLDEHESNTNPAYI